MNIVPRLDRARTYPYKELQGYQDFFFGEKKYSLGKKNKVWPSSSVPFSSHGESKFWHLSVSHQKREKWENRVARQVFGDSLTETIWQPLVKVTIILWAGFCQFPIPKNPKAKLEAHKSCANTFLLKKLPAKCWWNWLQINFIVSDGLTIKKFITSEKNFCVTSQVAFFAVCLKSSKEK